MQESYICFTQWFTQGCDPAAVQRAALDGLSTKRRLRTAVLPVDESGEEQTVNVKRLGRAQRAQLVSKVGTALCVVVALSKLLRRWRATSYSMCSML